MNAGTREDAPARKSEIAYERIKALLISGGIRPGRHLATGEVAEWLGISATPTRDAMVRLACEGLLEYDPSHGFYTKEYRVEENRQIIAMLDVNLVYGLRTARGRIPDGLLIGLAGLQDAAATSPEGIEGVAARIREMYLEVARAAGNDVLRETCRILVDRSHLIRVLDIQIGDAGRQTIDDLRAMGAAMAEGNIEGTVAVAQAILSRRIERLPLLVKEANFIASEATFP